jgi:glutamate racemase
MKFSTVLLLTIAAVHSICVSRLMSDEVPHSVVQPFIEHGLRNPEGTAPFSVDLSARDGNSKDLPIGVFDSGIGGLTVLEAILGLDEYHNDTLRPGKDGRRDFEDESFIYFGDQANMPYGNYPSAGRQDYLRELILKDAAFLLGRRSWPAPGADAPTFAKSPVKAIVIACNTATAWGISDVRKVIEAWKVPVIVIGVVEAGAHGVTELMERGDEPRTVAVLATVGTCSIQAYPNAIGKSAGIAGKRVPRIVQQGSVSLAGAIEGDPAFITSQTPTTDNSISYLGPAVQNSKSALQPSLLPLYGFDDEGLLGNSSNPDSLRLNSVANYVRYDITTLMHDYKASGATEAINTVVLGCTHFPLVEDEIRRTFARLRTLEVDGSKPFEALISDQLEVVDPAEMTARALFRELARSGIRRVLADSDRSTAQDQFFISVANRSCSEVRLAADGSLEADYKYARIPGRLNVEDTICVPMRISLLPDSSAKLIRSRLPEVWTRLQQSP